MNENRFWETKKLSEMTSREWEMLCDRCGRCCLYAIDDRQMGTILYTKVACKFLDTYTSNCTVYDKRKIMVPNCKKVTKESLHALSSLPDTCAYRILAGGGKLKWWHPLISGSAETVHKAGISVRERKVISESDLCIHQFTDHIDDIKVM